MKTPLAKAVLTGVALIIVFQLLFPAVKQRLWPASSSVAIEPSPANQMRSIVMRARSAATFIPPSLARELKPTMVEIRIHPHQAPDPSPSLFVNCKDGMMEVHPAWVSSPRGVFDTPFSEEAIARVLEDFRAPRSPQQGTLDAREAYLAISAVCSADIRDKSIPALASLSHYSLSFVHNCEATWFRPETWLMALYCAAMTYFQAYQSSRKKDTQQSGALNG
jgi:hypothetical protein